MSDETPTNDNDKTTVSLSQRSTACHSENRTAGRDYYENRTTGLSNHKFYLLTQTDDELDRQFIQSGEFFRHYFLRDYDPVLREKVIALKQAYGWTARELRHLCLTGWLEINRMTGAVKPNLSVGMYRYGLVLLAWITLYCGCEILSVACSDGPPGHKKWAELGIFATWASSAFFLNLLFFKPYQLLTRTKTRAGQS